MDSPLLWQPTPCSCDRRRVPGAINPYDLAVLEANHGMAAPLGNSEIVVAVENYFPHHSTLVLNTVGNENESSAPAAASFPGR